jgi:hypothetical protein
MRPKSYSYSLSNTPISRAPAFVEQDAEDLVNSLIESFQLRPGKTLQISRSEGKRLPKDDELERIKTIIQEFGLDQEQLDKALNTKYQGLQDRADALAKAVEGREFANFFDVSSLTPLVRLLGGPDLGVKDKSSDVDKKLEKLIDELNNRELEKYEAKAGLFKLARDLFPQGAASSARLTEASQRPAISPSLGYQMENDKLKDIKDLSKRIGPNAIFALNIAKELKTRMGGMDPNDSSPVPGFTPKDLFIRKSTFGLKNAWDAEGAKNYQDIMNLLRFEIFELSGKAATDKEREFTERVNQLNQINSPQGVRKFVRDTLTRMRKQIASIIASYPRPGVKQLWYSDKDNVVPEYFDEILNDKKDGQTQKTKIIEAAPGGSKKKSLDIFK